MDSDYIKEVEKQLGDEQVYEEVSTDAAALLKTINEVMAKIRKRGDLKRDSSVKWSNPGHFLKSQGKFFFVISMYPFLHIF